VRWRVGLPWYVIALGLPTVLSLATAALAYLLGAPKLLQVGILTIFDIILFVLVVGEELGWRGYALPLLLEKRSPVTASVILGVVTMAFADLPGGGNPAVWIAVDGVRAADDRVFDLDDLGVPAYVGQRVDRHSFPRRDQSLPGPLFGWHGRC